jgi:serine/threonine-protein kinase
MTATTRHAAVAQADRRPQAVSTGASRFTGKNIGLGVAALAVLGLIIFVATRLFGGPAAPEQVTVRDVSGQVQEAAREQLISQGLKPNIRSVPSPDSPQVPAGQAIKTEPAANSQVAKGTQIDLYISKGPAQVTVPDLTGKSQSEAQQALLVANLTLAPTPTYNPTFDPNQVDKVMGQTPKPGQSAPGQSQVTITIGQKQQGVKVPADIVGMTEDDARSKLEGLGLTVQSSEVDGPGEQGTVINSNPGPGKDVAINGTITLSISRGNGQLMPDLKNDTMNDAKSALRDAGFRSSNIHFQDSSTDDPTEDGRVIDQSIPKGTVVTKDSEVTLTVGQYN